MVIRLQTLYVNVFFLDPFDLKKRFFIYFGVEAGFDNIYDVFPQFLGKIYLIEA